MSIEAGGLLIVWTILGIYLTRWLMQAEPDPIDEPIVIYWLLGSTMASVVVILAALGVWILREFWNITEGIVLTVVFGILYFGFARLADLKRNGK